MTPTGQEILDDLVRWKKGAILSAQEVRSFCNETSITSGGGCAKYLECSCGGELGACSYLSRQSCSQLRTTEKEAPRLDLRNHGSERCNPYAILEPWRSDRTSTTCGTCNKRQACRDFKPSSCFGCVVPTEKDPIKAAPDQGRVSELLCPFARIKGKTNPARFLQCYLTRRKFVEYQTKELGLFLLAFVYARHGGNFVYATKSWDTRIVLRNFRCQRAGESLLWEPDSREQLSTYVFQHLREIQHEVRYSGSEPPHFVRLLSGLRKSSGADEFDEIERDVPCLYAPDGELSAFLLSWRLRKVLDGTAPRKINDWLRGAAIPQVESLDTVESKLKVRLEGTGLKDFVPIEHWELLFGTEQK